MDIWNPEFLSKLEMDSNKELFDHLSIEALKSGFKLCSRYGFLEPYGNHFHRWDLCLSEIKMGNISYYCN